MLGGIPVGDWGAGLQFAAVRSGVLMRGKIDRPAGAQPTAWDEVRVGEDKILKTRRRIERQKKWRSAPRQFVC